MKLLIDIPDRWSILTAHCGRFGMMKNPAYEQIQARLPRKWLPYFIGSIATESSSTIRPTILRSSGILRRFHQTSPTKAQREPKMETAAAILTKLAFEQNDELRSRLRSYHVGTPRSAEEIILPVYREILAAVIRGQS